MQLENAGPSSAHSNVEPVSLDVNANCATGFVVVPDVPDEIVVWGGVVSAVTVQFRVAGVWSKLPAASRARTRNWCEPTGTVYETPDAHGAKAALSSEHSNVAVVSGELKVNCATGFVVEDGGPELIVVFGALVSTVMERLAGVWSRLPAGSVARTRNVCAPLDRDDVVNGDEHEVKEAVSTEHWNVEPVSVDAKANVGVESLVGPLGPEVNDVSGASVSTVKLRVAGLWSVFPAASVARTSKVWAPSARTAVVTGETQPAKAAPSTEHCEASSRTRSTRRRRSASSRA